MNKLIDSLSWKKLQHECNDIFESWCDYVEENDSDELIFKNKKDVLKYIQDATWVYEKSQNSQSGRGHRKCYSTKNIYCYTLHDKKLYIYIYENIDSPVGCGNFIDINIYFSNEFTKNYL